MVEQNQLQPLLDAIKKANSETKKEVIKEQPNEKQQAQAKEEKKQPEICPFFGAFLSNPKNLSQASFRECVGKICKFWGEENCTIVETCNVMTNVALEFADNMNVMQKMIFASQQVSEEENNDEVAEEENAKDDIIDSPLVTQESNNVIIKEEKK